MLRAEIDRVIADRLVARIERMAERAPFGNAADADLDTPGHPFAVAAHLDGRPRLVRNPRLRPWNMIEASLQSARRSIRREGRDLQK
jgi:hypothetical protein